MGVMPGPFLRTASYACSCSDFLKPAASCHGRRCRNKPGAVDIELRFCQRKVSFIIEMQPHHYLQASVVVLVECE